MKILKKIIPIAVFILGMAAHINAQNVEISSRTEFIGNKTYYLHTVMQGQTIYGIAKAYSVDIRQIYSANPESVKGIQTGVILKIIKINDSDEIKYINHFVEKGETLYKIATNYYVKVDDLYKVNTGLTDKIAPGQLLKIPLAEKIKTVQKPVGISIHIVQKNETLYSIAKQYSITVDELKKLNSGLTDALQLGQQLKVPLLDLVQKHVIKDTIIPFECGKTDLLSTYNIGIMIPFYLDHSSSIDTGNVDIPTTSYKSLSFIQFYEGIRMALDSLEKAGLSLKVYFYDVAEDTNATFDLLKKPEFAFMNLIIGPLFSNNFTIVSSWAKQHAVPIINPFTNKNDLIKDNPFAFKLITSLQSESKQIIGFIENTYSDCNLIIVHNDKEKEFADSLKNIADKEVLLKKSKLSISMVNYSTEGLTGITKNLSETNTNIIITLMDGEAFVSSYLRNLNSLAYQHKIVLFGKKNWEDYSSLEIEYLMNLNTHIYTNSFIDFKNNKTQDFILNFRNTYKTDPDYYAFQGYDIMIYYGYALKNYGRNFQNCISKYSPELLETNFSFQKTVDGGFENTLGIIYRYEDYKMLNATLYPKKEINLLEKKKQ
ncbi:MAG: LysM peptidoglycan-binding domain-containing protein [Bacteroidota bacterium]